MKNITKTKNILFYTSLLLSILFVPGILMIIFGFANGIIFLGVLGIVIVVAGFYGMPILWSKYGEFKYYYRLCHQIIVEKINYVSLLSETNQKDIKSILSDINFLITKGYLIHYLLKDNEKLIDLSTIGDKKDYMSSVMNDTLIIKCPNCGASCKITDDIYKCSYCGTLLDKNSVTK